MVWPVFIPENARLAWDKLGLINAQKICEAISFQNKFINSVKRRKRSPMKNKNIWNSEHFSSVYYKSWLNFNVSKLLLPIVANAWGKIKVQKGKWV